MYRSILLILSACLCAGCPSASTGPMGEPVDGATGGAPVDIIAPIEIGDGSGGSIDADDPLSALFDDDIQPPLLVNPLTADPFTAALLYPELADEIFDVWLDAGLVDLGGGLSGGGGSGGGGSGGGLNGSYTYLERLCIAQGQPDFICQGLYGR